MPIIVIFSNAMFLYGYKIRKLEMGDEVPRSVKTLASLLENTPANNVIYTILSPFERLNSNNQNVKTKGVLDTLIDGMSISMVSILVVMMLISSASMGIMFTGYAAILEYINDASEMVVLFSLIAATSYVSKKIGEAYSTLGHWLISATTELGKEARSYPPLRVLKWPLVYTILFSSALLNQFCSATPVECGISTGVIFGLTAIVFISISLPFMLLNNCRWSIVSPPQFGT